MIENKSCPRCSSLFPAEQVDGDFSGICPRCLAGILLEPESPLKPGATFGGFEVLDVLGQGGMGVVYKARQTSLNRIVALKVLSPQTAGSKEFALRFDREAKVLASLNHPNVVQVHDFGREADVPYLVMEYVDGETLESAFKRLDRPRLMEVIRDVVRGLRKVHEAGLIHRDLKPANIFLSRDGAAKIGDFGLAVRTEADCHVTEHGYFVGTPHYASPEHAQGSAVDARSDLYALGAILYEGFAGRPPFQAPSPAQVLAKHVDEPAPALDGPKDVADLVRRLLEKDPAKRFATAAELEAALARASLETPKRRPWPLFAAAAAALLLALALFFRPSPAGFAPLLAASEALAADNFDAAAEEVEKARRDPAWEAQAVALTARLSALRAAKQEEDLGHYYCFSKGEWDKGLPLIAAGEDSPYREAARRDLEGKTPADAWLELAKSAKPRWAERMRERAWAWLDAAGDPRAAELDRTLEARREIDLLRLSPQLSQGKLRTSELQPLPYLPPAAYDLEIEAEGELLVWLPGAGGRRVSSGKLRVRDGRASAGTPADLRVAEPRLFHVQGALAKLTLRAVLPATRAEVDDLVRRVDVKRDAVVGAWTIDGGELVSPVADYARIQIPADLPEEYDFEARVERRQGSAVGIGLVSGGRPFAVMVDSHYATLSGIDMIDGRRVQDNEATWKGKALEDFKPAQVRVEVRRGGVRLLVDGRALVDWKGDRERLSLPRDWAAPNPRRPWVSAWASVVRFSRITVTPAAEGVDLLALVDPARDAAGGVWSREGTSIVSDVTKFARLELPFEPPAEYDLRVVFERVSGASDINQVLVAGGRQFVWVLAAGNSRYGFGLVNGEWIGSPKNPTLGDAPGFRAGERHESLIQVRRDRVTCSLDGRRLLSYATRYHEFSMAEGWRLRRGDRLGLASYESPTRFHSARLTPVGAADVDLLRLIDPERDSVRGRWAMKDGTLESPSPAGVDDLLQLPHAPAEEYDLRATLVRKSGNDGFGIGLVAGGRQFTLSLGSHGGGVTGLSLIDGRDASQNETTSRDFLFPKDIPVQLRVSVRKDRLQVFVNDRRIIDWAADYARCSQRVPWKVPSPRALSLSAFRGTWAVRSLSVGAAIEPREEGVDLLADLDVARNTIEGAWKVESGQLVSAPSFSSIAIPYEPADEYDLEMNIERKLKDEAVVIVLPVSGRQVALTLDSFGTSSGLDSIDGRGMGFTERKGRVLTTDRDHALKVSVRRDGVRAEVSGQVIVDWKGDPARLSAPGHLKLPARGFALAAWTTVRVSRMSLRPTTEVFVFDGMPRAASGYIDLLPRVDPRRDAVKGGWELKDGRLVSDNAERAVLEIPYEPPAEYDFRVSFTRKGISDVNQILTRNGTSFAWCMGGMANVWSGFGSIKDIWAPEPGNPSRVRLGLDENRIYESLVQVRTGSVRAYLDGKLVCQWRTDYRDLSLQPAWSVRNPHRLGLGTFHSPTTFHAIEVRPLSRPTSAVDLLPLVNPERDTVKGDWTRDAEGSLVSPRTPEARIHLPYDVPAEYDLEITAERRSEDERSFHIGLPFGGRGVLVTLDGFGSDRCALENVDGRPELDFRGGVFTKAGVPVTVTCRVRRDGLRVLAAGRTILEWKEDARRLGMPNDWKGTRPSAPLLGTFKSEFRVVAVRLSPPDER